MAYDLEPSIWKACAGGASVEIPTVDSRVYYFPQGHAEQASSPPDFSTLRFVNPYFLCRIVSVRFLANPDTDEVFAKIRLQPIYGSSSSSSSSSSRVGFVKRVRRILEGEDDDQDTKITSFAKILTTSDANNGGGFSVPRFCAETIFPILDYKASVPVQNISVRDVHGVVWDFRHIYRGTPQRHLLTTGWSRFVNHKKLVAGDSVVFMKNQIDEISVGIRRKIRVAENVDLGRWNYENLTEEEGRSGGGFSRNVRGRVPAASVLEAVELAGRNREFEVVWYPRVGSAEYVVKAEKVEESLNMYWTAGMTIKMPVETEDSSRVSWFQGIITSAAFTDHGPWRGSPWRMLQVTWDEPKDLQDVKRVSPWQIELVATTPSLQPPFPPSKRLRGPQNSELLTDGNDAPFFPMTGLTNSMMENLRSPLFNHNSFPAGMQGARQDPISVSAIPNSVGNDTNHMMYPEHVSGNNTSPISCSVATDLNIGGISQADNLSPNSQDSVHFFGTEPLGNQTYNSTKKTGISSIQLFGKRIYTDQPVETDFDDIRSTEVDDVTGFDGTVGVINPLDTSVSSPCKKLPDEIDVPYLMSAVKEFSL